MKIAKIYNQRYEDLLRDILNALAKRAEGSTFEIDPFYDEVGNEILGLEENMVIGDLEGEYIEYPISELKLVDALHILACITEND